MIGTPEEVIKRIMAAQQACSFSEITIVSQFGTMPHDEAQKSTRLFAREVLPVVHRMEAPLHAAALPAAEL
jgi:alkanesulfonate monooxygenase SsuD/methylene tetrahydromethanopterin reductase-like flavin-dependent oxidoreductase (luciferase family)